ncbi:MAG: hypothetical protein ACJ77K_01960 [Bacteroidia bacterium]
MQRIRDFFAFRQGIPAVQPDLFSADRLRAFFLALIQLGLLFLIVVRFQVEKSSGIIEYAVPVLIAFVIYSFLPFRFRPAFLALFTIGIIYSAFGILAGSFMLLGSGTLILICHLPLRFNLRLALILVVGLFLAVFRTEIFFIPWMSMAIMYFVPMFMFRLIIYLYELKHGLVPKSGWQSITYFFLFPNIFFLFFPIIDYKNYVRNWHSVPEKETWQKGVRWMLRGLTHIMVYRLICFNLLIDTTSVADLPSLLQYITVSYSLILRLSGIFHFIVGLLCMFGMNLPPVFDNYFIATSFVDLWRRINIYWRDFILKVFFYPIMFRYKKYVKKNLLAVTMMTTFVVTWLLHSWQLFWVTGSFSVKLIDAIFWLTVGACITINSVIIERRTIAGKKNEASKRDFGYFGFRALRILGMFLFMSVMWSLWNSRSLEDWLFILSKAKVFTPGQLLHVLSFTFYIIIFIVLAQLLMTEERIRSLFSIKPSDTLALTLPSLLLLLLCSFKPVQSAMPAGLQSLVQNMANSSPNIIDKTNAEIGYYDRLIEGDEQQTIGIGGKSFKKMVRKNPYTDAYYLTQDIMHRRMKPNLKIEGIDHDFRSNSFGIRDKEYSVEKPPHTYRAALLGGSYEMGSGVNNDEVFEAIVEERMNKEGIDYYHSKLEILNFAAGAYYLMQHVELCNTTVFKYHPDAVIYFAHSDEKGKVIKDFTALIKHKEPLKYQFLEEIKSKAGVKSYMSALQIRELLTPYVDEIVKWGYAEIARKCKENNATPVWVFLPTTTETVDQKEFEELKALTESMGYVTLDMRDAYGDTDRKLIQISEWNTHPNVLGHRLMAARFYRELKKNLGPVFGIKK